MQNISHIIWDWNGTLLDDTQACVNSVNKMLTDRDLPRLTVERYRDIFGFPVSDFYRKIGFVLENEDWDAMAVEFHDLFLADDATGLHADALRILAELQEGGFCQSVLSASEQSILDSMIVDFNLGGYFKWIRGVNNLYGDSKLAVGKGLVDDLNIPAGNIMIIGDSLHDHEVSLELGIQCVLVAGGHQSYERLAKTGVTVLESLSGIPRLLFV